MSEAIVLNTIATKLRELDIWDSNNCMARFDERPDPVMGDRFCSVHMVEHQTRSQTDGGQTEELLGFGITITKRITAVPGDKISESYERCFR